MLLNPAFFLRDPGSFHKTNLRALSHEVWTHFEGLQLSLVLMQGSSLETLFYDMPPPAGLEDDPEGLLAVGCLLVQRVGHNLLTGLLIIYMLPFYQTHKTNE